MSDEIENGENTNDEDKWVLDETDVDDFELDSWLDGAEVTRKSVDVYAAGRLVAERDELERQIQAVESPQVRALGGEPADELRREWKKITQKILDSRLTVVVQALSKDRIREITEVFRKEHKIKDEHMPVGRAAFDPIKLRKWDQEGQTDACVREAIVALKTPSGKVLDPPFSSEEQLDKFIAKIGPSQWSLITEAFENAVSKSPVVGTDFSPESSPDEDGEDS